MISCPFISSEYESDSSNGDRVLASEQHRPFNSTES